MKDKNHMDISINANKVPDEIQHPFITKTLNKLGKEENYLYLLRYLLCSEAHDLLSSPLQWP